VGSLPLFWQIFLRKSRDNWRTSLTIWHFCQKCLTKILTWWIKMLIKINSILSKESV
jgi:hypothetical protein